MTRSADEQGLQLPESGFSGRKQGPEGISVIMAPGSRLAGGSKAVGRFLGRPALALTTAFVANMAPPTYPGWGTKSSLLGSPRPGSWGILPERRRGCAAMQSSIRPMDDPLSTARARGEMGKSITLLEQRLAELGLTTALIPPVRLEAKGHCYCRQACAASNTRGVPNEHAAIWLKYAI